MPNGAKVCIIGNLIKDPETSNTKAGSVTKFTVAVNTTMKKATGDGYESNFYNVSVWGKPGEWLMDKLQKGTSVEVVGGLMQRTYQNSNGQEAKSLDVQAWSVQPLMRMKGGSNNQSGNSSSKSNSDSDSGLPF